MTRIDDVRAATTGSAKEGMRHAKAVKDTVAPRANQAALRAQASAQKAQLSARQAQQAAREQFHGQLAPRLSHAKETLPPALDEAATKAVERTREAAERTREAAERTREAARNAADYAVPRIEAARAVAVPAKDEALARSTAALAALRGEVTAEEVDKLTRRRVRRARTGKAMKRIALLGLVAGAAYAAYRWWDRQANPDWLVEPPAATEVSEDLSDGAPTRGSEVRDQRDDAGVGSSDGATRSSDSGGKAG